MTSQSYISLEVWQKAMAFVTKVYTLTKLFPKEELYSLTNQIRRAAVSIPSNIAEGRSRHTTKDYMRFIIMARGSVAELETQLLISKNLGYVTEDKLQPLLKDAGEIGRMLSGSSQDWRKNYANPRNSPSP